MKRASFMIAVLFLLPALAGAQQYEPSVGQEGKDVIWVPTPEDLVEAMLDAAKVTPNDSVMDLGSGDGRLVIAAAKRGARAVGVEYNPDMVTLSRANAEKAGVSAKATFLNADLFATDISKATVITMYLLPSLNLKLRPTILDLKPGTRVVSHAFNMEDWEPDQTATVEGRDAYLWIVPAKVQGNWALAVPAGNGEEKWQIALKQTFQKISGTARLGDKSYNLTETRLRGADVTFAFVDGNGVKRQFTGRAAGDKMEGATTTQGGAKVNWSATRGRAS